ncbi:hypothetical protein FHX44_116549 [Pseudonocardia hierapolitana]|uniref:Uncharacterized protein n=1 Tax=Pseudonocardia hierapolitana TaxID=1128676 RepID=A0A561T0E9_9PSEU|nr:hypothetical protein [Pseudonocardia hierapolitana]TWF80606.1 hypothetical protein FHX44_116549 [Pseudonocardia hierapolitana]
MNELQLPPAPPLPDEVRERALRTVLAGTRAPRRRFAPLVAAVVVVMATLAAVTTAVAMTGPGADELDPRLAASGPPAPTGDPAIDEALGRCAAAVATSGSRDEYPPTAGWRVTDVLSHAGEGQFSDTDLVIDGSFACHAGPYHVWVSTVGGRPAGGIEVARLGPGSLVLFNPQRLLVEVDPGDGYVRTSTTAVQIVSLTPAHEDWPVRRLIVRGSYDGPLPDPGEAAVEVQDRPILNGQAQPTNVEACLDDQLGTWALGSDEPQETVLTQDAQGDLPRALVGRVNGRWAAVCYDGPEGPVAVEGPLDPARLSETRLVSSRRRDDLVVALLTVAPDGERVEIATTPEPGAVGSGAACTLRDGLALCMLRAEGAVDVRIFSGGVGTTMPVP